TEEHAELGNVAPGRGIGGDDLQEITAAQVADLVVQHHHRLGAVEAAGVENGVGLQGHRDTPETGAYCGAKRARRPAAHGLAGNPGTQDGSRAEPVARLPRIPPCLPWTASTVAAPCRSASRPTTTTACRKRPAAWVTSPACPSR